MTGFYNRLLPMPTTDRHPHRRWSGDLIVSCQAEGDDPFNQPELLARFARAAEMGGAAAIRAREAVNVRAIRAAVELPVIGLTKGAYGDGSVLITPDRAAVHDLLAAGANLVALDVTGRLRPDGQAAVDLLHDLLTDHPDVAFMADIATLSEGVMAAEAGAHVVGTTLSGYTPQSAEVDHDGPDWALIEGLARELAGTTVKLVAEGRIWTPAEARRALDLGAHAVVVGTAITRPRVVTQTFVHMMRA